MEIVNQSCTSLKITSPITSSADSFSTYNIRIVMNCCSTIFDNTVTINEDSSFTITADMLTIGTLQSGIYSIKLTMKTPSGSPPVDTIETDDNCIFVDCNFKCDFKDKIEVLLIEGPSYDKQVALESVMLHYTLTNSSGCGCNCSELCDLYKQLYKLTYGDNLPSSNDIQISDCGC